MASVYRIDDGLSRADQRRQRITDAARKLFVQNGFHATGMAQLAKESGIAIGQIYRDFASKEDIVAALVAADCGRLMMYEELDVAISTRDSAAARRWLRDYLDPGAERDGARLYAEIVAESGRNPRIAAIFHELHDQLRRHLRAALALVAPTAPDGRREVMAEALMALSIGMFQYWFIAPERDIAPVLHAFHTVLDQQLAGLMRDGGDGAGGSAAAMGRPEDGAITGDRALRAAGDGGPTCPPRRAGGAKGGALRDAAFGTTPHPDLSVKGRG